MEIAVFHADRKFVPPETYDAFFAVIERLEAAIEDETAALAAGRHAALPFYTGRKRQGFLELNRIAKTLEQTIPSQDILARLAGFREKLRANDAMLRVHLRATQEVTTLIVKVMRDAESDGTYSRGHGRSDFRTGYDDA